MELPADNPEGIISAALRRCSRCRQALPREAFRRNSHGWLRAECIACQRVTAQEWRARHHDQLLAARRERYAALRAAGVSSVEANRRKDGPRLVG